MRSTTAPLIAVALAAAALLWASAAPAQTNRPAETNSSQGTPSQGAPAAHSCPPGTHWEEAGYIHDGKWRDAGCLKNGGRE